MEFFICIFVFVYVLRWVLFSSYEGGVSFSFFAGRVRIVSRR